MKKTEHKYRYCCKLMRVVDGDTILLQVDLGFRINLAVTCRLSRVNSQELNSSDPIKKKKAIDAKNFLLESIKGEELLYLESTKLDVYGRSIGEVYLGSGDNLSDLLLERSDIFEEYVA